MHPAAPNGQAPSAVVVSPQIPPGWTQEQWRVYGAQWQAQQAAGQSPLQQQAVAMAQVAVQQTAPASPQLLPGVSIVGGNDNKSPMLTVSAYEKMGKSATVITSLRDWPEPGMDPLVLAFDAHGPDACVRLGYHPHAIRIREQPGESTIERTRNALQMLHTNINYVRRRYGAVVVDCGSTMVMQLHDDAKNTPKNRNNPDTRAPYFDLGLYTKEVIRKVMDLQLPNIWLAWLMEGSTNTEKDQTTGQNKKSTDMGGPDIMGRKVRNWIAGTSHHNIVLEKYRVAKGGVDPWGGKCDDEDFVRVFHTKPWGLINAGGRYSHVLPDPAPANMGWVLSMITGRGPYARRG